MNSTISHFGYVPNNFLVCLFLEAKNHAGAPLTEMSFWKPKPTPKLTAWLDAPSASGVLRFRSGCIRTCTWSTKKSQCRSEYGLACRTVVCIWLRNASCSYRQLRCLSLMGWALPPLHKRWYMCNCCKPEEYISSVTECGSTLIKVDNQAREL